MVLEQLQLARTRKRLGATFDRELAVEVVDVAFDRADRNDQCIGDRLVRMPLGDQAQDFELAVGQGLNQG
jgi:hypothetical protein